MENERESESNSLHRKTSSEKNTEESVRWNTIENSKPTNEDGRPIPSQGSQSTNPNTIKHTVTSVSTVSSEVSTDSTYTNDTEFEMETKIFGTVDQRKASETEPTLETFLDHERDKQHIHSEETNLQSTTQNQDRSTFDHRHNQSVYQSVKRPTRVDHGENKEEQVPDKTQCEEGNDTKTDKFPRSTTNRASADIQPQRGRDPAGIHSDTLPIRGQTNKVPSTQEPPPLATRYGSGVYSCCSNHHSNGNISRHRQSCCPQQTHRRWSNVRIDSRVLPNLSPGKHDDDDKNKITTDAKRFVKTRRTRRPKRRRKKKTKPTNNNRWKAPISSSKKVKRLTEVWKTTEHLFKKEIARLENFDKVFMAREEGYEQFDKSTFIADTGASTHMVNSDEGMFECKDIVEPIVNQI